MTEICAKKSKYMLLIKYAIISIDVVIIIISSSSNFNKRFLIF